VHFQPTQRLQARFVRGFSALNFVGHAVYGPAHAIKSRLWGKFACPLPDQGVKFAVTYDRNSPEKRLFGYARVSTVGRTLDSQLGQLRAVGCSSRNIYREKATGARPDRRELNRMLGKLAPRDVVTVTRIDRLAVAPSTCSPSSSAS